MKLFLLTTEGLGDYYIIAETPNDAEKLLDTQLNEADYGFSSNRIVRNIKILTSEIKIGFNDKLNFNDNNRMIIFKGALANER
jgi:hypothetical protein